MTGTIIDREIVHYTEERVEYADAAQAVKGIAEREVEGWSVIDRRHDDPTVTVVFRTGDEHLNAGKIVSISTADGFWVGELDDLLHEGCHPFSPNEALAYYHDLMKK